MRRSPPVLALLVCGLSATLSACGGGVGSGASAGGEDNSGSGPAAASSHKAGAAGSPAPLRAGAGGAGATPTLGVSVGAAGPDIVETGRLAVRIGAARRLHHDAAEVSALAAREGGYVQASTVTSGRAARATLTVRVPDDRLAATVAAVSALGDVTASTEDGEDVTGQVVDLAAEQANLDSEARAVRGILRRASKVADILRIQQQLFTLQGEISELSAQRNSLANQVAYASLAVTLTAHAAPAPPVRHQGTLARFWSLASSHTVAAARGLFLAVGWAAPGLVLVAAAAGGYVLVRRRRRAGLAAADGRTPPA